MMTVVVYMLAAMTLASAAAVIAFRNPVHSALSLVLHLLGIASLYATLDAHFLAVAQVVVYAGAIMVLVLFVIMLLNLRVEASRKPSFLAISAAFAVGALFLFIVVPILISSFGAVSYGTMAENALKTDGTAKGIGRELYTKWIIPFEIASLLIMAGVVGAVTLARGPNRVPPAKEGKEAALSV